jgi:hypothetical protein
MPADPNECRRHAANCKHLAKTAAWSAQLTRLLSQTQIPEAPASHWSGLLLFGTLEGRNSRLEGQIGVG